MTVLCVATCARKGWHNTDCDGEPCGGCQPWPAADGIHLCDRHLHWLAQNATEAAELYDELGLVLAATGPPTERTSGTKASVGIDLNERALEARRDIKHTLTSWTLMIAEQRGWSLPKDTVKALGAYIANSAEWLAAHPAAGEAADELAALVRRGRAIARPSGTFRATRDCPMPGCGGTITALLDDDATLELPAEVTCTGDDHHTWTSNQYDKLDRLCSAVRRRQRQEAAA